MVDDERATVRGKLQTWLTEEEFEDIHSVDESESYFTFEMKHQLGMVLRVKQLLKDRDKIGILSGLALTNEQRRLLEEMTDSKLQEFLWDLRFSLLSRHVSFKLDSKGSIPHQIAVAQFVWYDGLTKNGFMKAIQTVIEAVIVAQWKLSRLEGAPAPKQDPNPYIG